MKISSTKWKKCNNSFCLDSDNVVVEKQIQKKEDGFLKFGSPIIEESMDEDDDADEF